MVCARASLMSEPKSFGHVEVRNRWFSAKRARADTRGGV